MKYFFVSLLFITFLVFSSAAQVQDLSVDLRLFNTQARIFYVGDLDPAGLGNAPNYFILEIRNNGATERNVKLKFSVIGNNVPFVEGETEAFRLPGNRVYLFNNNQLNTGVIIDEQEIKLGNYRINFSEIADLENRVTATGKLPAGVYEFRVELFSPPNSMQPIPDINTDDNILIISNPTTIEPISPGNRVNSRDVPEIPTTTPYFIWQSDAGLFNLLIYRKYEAEDIQDVLSRDPILRLERYPNQVFQYPSETSPLLFLTDDGSFSGSRGAVRLIEPGYIYYWYVEALIPSASGLVNLPSDVYQFKVADRERAAANRNQILVYLRQILGQEYDQYMSQLQGYDPSGYLLIGSSPIEIQDLEEFVKKLVAGKITIQEVIIEN
jgi:hypothetical protein